LKIKNKKQEIFWFKEKFKNIRGKFKIWIIG